MCASNQHENTDRLLSDLRSLLSEIRDDIRALRKELVDRPIDPQLLTREEAAEHLRISVRTLDTLEDAGEIGAIRIRGRVLYHRETLDAFLRRRSRT